MSLQDDVCQVLHNTGAILKKDLWGPNDVKILAQHSRDLVGLQAKAQATTDPQTRAQYQFAARMVVDHVAMIALTRMHVAQQHVAEALEKLFWEVVLPKLATILVGLF